MKIEIKNDVDLKKHVKRLDKSKVCRNLKSIFQIQLGTTKIFHQHISPFTYTDQMLFKFDIISNAFVCFRIYADYVGLLAFLAHHFHWIGVWFLIIIKIKLLVMSLLVSKIVFENSHLCK